MPATHTDPGPDTLAALLERVAHEDAAALRSLYELTSPKLFGLAIRILIRHEWAEEALQDAFVNVWRHAGEYRQNLSAPMTWLTAIVRHRALDRLRQQQSGTFATEIEWSEALDDLLPANDPDPSEWLSTSEQTRQLAHCIERLDANQRQAIALAYLREHSHGEVAQAMNAPLGTVKSWIRRGLDRLKTCLGAS